MELPAEIYDRIDLNNDGDIYIVVQVLPGRLAICVRESDVSGGASQVQTYLVQLPT